MIVGIGDLVVDLYYKNNKLVGIQGGKSFANIIANISLKRKIIGTVGNDIYGLMAINSLKRLNIILDLIIINKPTKKFHINKTTTKRCPYCNNKDWYEDKYDLKDKINKFDILVFDDFKYIDLIKLNNIKFIDIGYYNELDNMTNEEIINILNRFEFINMNERVEIYLKKRLNISDIKSNIIITRGKKGYTFKYNNKFINISLKNISKEIESNGAGDAFFGLFITKYINNNYKLDELFLNNFIIEANKLTSKVVSVIGARGHLYPLYKIRKINGVCTCQNIKIYNIDNLI